MSFTLQHMAGSGAGFKAKSEDLLHFLGLSNWSNPLRLACWASSRRTRSHLRLWALEIELRHRVIPIGRTVALCPPGIKPKAPGIDRPSGRAGDWVTLGAEFGEGRCLAAIKRGSSDGGSPPHGLSMPGSCGTPLWRGPLVGDALHSKRRLRRAADPQELRRGDGKDVPGRAGGGVDHLELGKARVPEGADRREMPDRRHPADGKAGLRPHRIGIRPVERFPRHGGGLRPVHLIAARGQEQDALPALMALKDDRLGNLVERTARRLRRLARGARLRAHLHRRGLQPRIAERLFHPSEALAHPSSGF